MVTILVTTLVWLVASEGYLLIRKRSKQPTVKRKRDGYSLFSLWIVISASVTGAVYWSANHSFHLEPWTVYTGLVLVIMGSTIRWLSIRQLKSDFTVDLSIKAQHQLTTTGMYRLIRHPSYSGLILYLMGIGIMLNNSMAFMIILFLPLIAISIRINLEEKMLEQEFGDKYRNYQSQSKKIIPFIY